MGRSDGGPSSIEDEELRRRSSLPTSAVSFVLLKHTNIDARKDKLELRQCLGSFRRPAFSSSMNRTANVTFCKSTVMDNLGWRIPQFNKDAVVLFHTADDSLYERHSRIIASKFHLASELFEVPKFYLDHPDLAAAKGCPNFEEVYPQAKMWLRELMESERLVVADVNLIAPTFPALRRWVSDMRKRFPDKHLLVLEDNFHLLELPGYDAGEAKIAAGSHFMKQMCNNFQVTIIGTMEITKSDLAPGKRPVLAALKGSSAIPYDVNANWVGYNDMADLMDQSQLYWEDAGDQVKEIGPSGEDMFVSSKKPVIEIICNKNKISGFKGTTFFRMWPESGRLEECTAREQSSLRAAVAASDDRRTLTRPAPHKFTTSWERIAAGTIFQASATIAFEWRNTGNYSIRIVCAFVGTILN
jgi:hypothetical protein